ncbi:zinc finger protein 862-like [Lingula anatina]|uniref:Zinc finger protein 862-like n=1 Tax=Lingula anatina TaxID=7574 RepID=A0A2R2MRQ2_LINAN|nr:zinc finger protein 862-like [Lingula anatina]|eukprot:XP_023932929.1 zinc finger protein 862-like [Lingula anatina]
MTCLLCKEHAGTSDSINNFVTGTTNFRIEAIKSHERSKCHERAVSIKQASESTGPAESQAGRTLQSLKAHERDRLSILFRNAHAVAKHHFSFKTFTLLCKLDTAKGLDVGVSYINDKKAAEFVKSIAAVEKKETSDIFKCANFVSITADGTSDFTGEEYESMFMRTCHQGKVVERFMGIGSPESATGHDIFTFIDSTCENFSSPEDHWPKICCFCADGASNMQGQRIGVASMVNSKNPETVIIHCTAHRLELAFKDAVKKSKLYEKSITLLMGLYYFYRKSPKQKRELLKTFDTLRMTSILPTRVGGTRWLPHLCKAIAAYLKGYRAIKIQLENSSHTAPKAQGLVKLMKNTAVMGFILDLKFILAVLMKLSLKMQERGISLADSFSYLEATKGVLIHMQPMPNEEVLTLLATKSYMDESLTGDTGYGFHEPMVKQLINSLENRFPKTNIVQASAISSFRNWPETNEADYGDEMLKEIYSGMLNTLVNGGFDSDCSLSELLTEWVFLKSYVYNRHGSNLKSLTWTSVLPLVAREYKNISLVMDLLLTLPPTSVNNETTFSRSKLTKNKRRGHLQTSNLNDILVVETCSPPVEEFDPKNSIDHWMVTPSGRRRRVGYTRPKPLSSASTSRECDMNPIETEPESLPSTSRESDSDLISIETEPETLPSTSREPGLISIETEPESLPSISRESEPLLSNMPRVAESDEEEGEMEEDLPDTAGDSYDSDYYSEEEITEAEVNKNLAIYAAKSHELE